MMPSDEPAQKRMGHLDLVRLLDYALASKDRVLALEIIASDLDRAGRRADAEAARGISALLASDEIEMLLALRRSWRQDSPCV